MLEAPSSAPIAAVVLAAGRSRRLGRPKQLVEVGGEPLVRRAARAAAGAGLTPVVVAVSPGADAVIAALEGLGVEPVEVQGGEEGMSASVKAGVARALALSPGAAAVVLVACDQPRVDAEQLRRLVAARARSGLPIAASEYAGVRGVPALLGREILGEVAALGGDAGAREIIRRDPARVTPVPFPGGELDVDAEGDLQAWHGRDPGG